MNNYRSTLSISTPDHYISTILLMAVDRSKSITS